MKEIILAAEHLHYHYPDGTPALDGLSLSLERGRKIGIVGPNGAGKTTLFLMFNGVLRPDAGQLLFAGKKMRYKKDEIRRLRSHVGLVFQDASTQLFAATVYQELAFGPCNLDLPEASVKGRVEEILESLNIADLKDKPTHFLSGGEKKKVAIASVLTMRPEVVIFDEPFANLDPKSAQQIGHIIDSLNQAGKTIVVATHDVDMIYAWADYVYVLHRGKLLGEGTPRAVFTDVTLIDTAHLVKPWIVEVYEEFLDGQPALKDEVPVPEDKSSLFGLIKTLMSGDRH